PPRRPGHPRGEGGPGAAWGGARAPGRPKPPHLPDQASRDFEPAGGDVLPERSAGQFAAQPFHPPVQVLPGVGVKRLLVATVVRLVHLLVTGQAQPADRDRALRGPLVDRGAPEPAGPLRVPPAPGVDRDHPCHRHIWHGIRRAGPAANPFPARRRGYTAVVGDVTSRADYPEGTDPAGGGYDGGTRIRSSRHATGADAGVHGGPRSR